MQLLIIAFFISLICNLILIRYQHVHQKISSDHDLSAPQKFHKHIVSRIGGISIFITILSSALLAHNLLSLESGSLLAQICLCALPAFTIGLMEDITKRVGVKMRLASVAFSAYIGIHFLNISITNIQVSGIDLILSASVAAIIFTIVAVTGLTNAYNIIDGFHGLASMVAIITLASIGFVAFIANDPMLTYVCMTVIGAIGGFFFWNYPRGKIFLGDGGAYLIGYFVAILSILLVIRNPSVSPWFALLVNAYPTFETLFTIWRRKVHQGKSPSLADGIHFHSLIYRRVIRKTKVHESKDATSYSKNAKTSLYLWFLSSLAVLPAIVWWHTTWILQCFALLFCITYIIAYNAMVKFKTSRIFNLFK